MFCWRISNRSWVTPVVSPSTKFWSRFFFLCWEREPEPLEKKLKIFSLQRQVDRSASSSLWCEKKCILCQTVQESAQMVDLSSSKWSEFRNSLCGLSANIFLDSSNHPKPWCILGTLSPQVLMWFGRVHSLEAKIAWIACSLPWLRSCHKSTSSAGCTSAKGSGRIVDCKHEDDESIDFLTCREGGRLASGIGSEDTLQIVEAYERNCWALWQGGGQQVQAQAQVQFKEAEKTVGPRSLRWPELSSCSGDRLDLGKDLSKIHLCLWSCGPRSPSWDSPSSSSVSVTFLPFGSLIQIRFSSCFHMPPTCIHTTTPFPSP